MTKVNNTLLEVKPGFMFQLVTLKQFLPDVETALFFAKAYSLNAQELGTLLWELFGHHEVLQALTRESDYHSSELQDYLVEIGFEYQIETGEIVLGSTPPKGEILPELWKAAELTIAESIMDVARKLRTVVGAMPGKEGEMLFKTMAVVNAKRPIIGDHKAHIHHAPHAPNLVILDVSGSMTAGTVETIIEDVVALSYSADAWLAIVSSSCTYWKPGEYDVQVVLDEAEYMGTHYETLSELLDMDWGVVVTIADYDSSREAMAAIAQCQGHIETVLDISLVRRPTFLSEVVGQLAQETKPLLVAANDYCCN